MNELDKALSELRQVTIENDRKLDKLIEMMEILKEQLEDNEKSI